MNPIIKLIDSQTQPKTETQSVGNASPQPSSFSDIRLYARQIDTLSLSLELTLDDQSGVITNQQVADRLARSPYLQKLQIGITNPAFDGENVRWPRNLRTFGLMAADLVDYKSIGRYCPYLEVLAIAGTGSVSLEDLEFIVRECPELKTVNIVLCPEVTQHTDAKERLLKAKQEAGGGTLVVTIDGV